MEIKLNKTSKKFSRFLRILGPGLVTGAADDDPSGIATYSQTGAQFGYHQLWTAFALLPLLIAIQENCARIGIVTGKGITALVKQYYGKKVLIPVVLLIAIANTINIGADLGALAVAASLITPLNFVFWIIFFTVFILLLEIFTSYHTYSRILKWLALTLLAYPLTLLIINIPWLTVLKATFIPYIELNFNFIFIITGVLGTTITPYMFFWESSQEVEEEKQHRIFNTNGKPKISRTYLHNMRVDNTIGMLASQIATWSIIVVTATTLHANGITTIRTASDAATALQPLVQTFPNSGYLAKLIFSCGIIGLGLLAIPVLSGSASYAVSEALNWKEGLNLKLKKAHGFYAVITTATIIGLIINFAGIDPIRALVVSGVLNGVVAVPLIFLVAKISANEHIMGEYKSGWLSKTVVWATFIGMLASSLALLYTFLAK
jgi:NRAMP (natural resistance-associated macrophage protein)-like metal ion transporter